MRTGETATLIFMPAVNTEQVSVLQATRSHICQVPLFGRDWIHGIMVAEVTERDIWGTQQ